MTRQTKLGVIAWIVVIVGVVGFIAFSELTK